jgi:hypothetical protein
VTLYENSRFGDEASVVIETSDGTLLGVTNDGPFLTEGTIDHVVESVAPEGSPEDPAGSVAVSGSYIISGVPLQVHEVINEGEAIVISIGTNTPLSVDLTLEYAGTAIALECDVAFAFDLKRIERRIGTPR